MRAGVGAASWRFAVFATVCLLAGFAMVAVFGQLRFGEHRIYKAEFISVTGLQTGNFVRIAGVEVGKVTNISITDNATALVEFSTDDSVVLTGGTRAVVRYQNLTGGRYLALQEGSGDVALLHPGETIPMDRTAPALDIDALIGGFRPLFRALNPDQINALTGQLITAFQGEDGTVDGLLQQIALLTDTLGNRDALIGQVITNLNTVLGAVSEHSKGLDSAVSSLSQLVSSLSARKEDLAAALGNVNAAAGTIADLLMQARAPLQKTVNETDRFAGLVVADHDYFNNLLETLPDSYRALARNGLYGDFFSEYLCDVYLKINGKGGQPVFVKVVGQPTGRCTPK
jgi:phospholipid/cholesterol/gamma-HCH transport system substrate-binding protein